MSARQIFTAGSAAAHGCHETAFANAIKDDK